MAENVGFDVKIGMDISEMQAELQKSQNLLREFQAQLKKSTNTIEINMLNNEIKTLNGTIGKLEMGMQKAGKPIGDASQSLINFSRIAQDAPYGIMGIANNLNPMVESFQRLSKTEGGTKKALQAMVSGLAGPAGIGVAIGVVSSLAVTFSKEISQFFKGPTEDLKTFNEELAKTANELYKLIGGEQTKRTKGIILATIIGDSKDVNQQEEALKKLKALYADDAAIKNAIIGQNKAYYQALVNNAAMQGDAIAKEKNNTAQLDLIYAQEAEQKKQRKAELDDLDKGIGLGFYKAEAGAYQKRIDYLKGQVNKRYDDAAKKLAADKARVELATYKSLLQETSVQTADGKTSTKKDPLAEATKDFENSKKRNLALFDGAIIDQQAYYTEYIKILDDYINKLKNINTEPAIKILKSLTPKEILKDDTYDADLERQAKGMNSFDGKSQLYVKSLLDPLGTKNPEGSVGKKKINTTKNELTEFLKDIKDQYKEAHDAANSFATDMAGNITGSLQSAFQAIKQGENVFKSLSDSVLQFAEDLAFAIIRAQIFAAISGAITIGSGGAAGAAAGGTGFFDILMGLLGMGQKHAAGGIVMSPQIGMIGEAGAEAIMPLSKLSGMLNTTFSAGAMSGGGGISGGSFVLRGQDLLVAINRTQKSSFLKGQNISLV
jgi:hypothetical protein